MQDQLWNAGPVKIVVGRRRTTADRKWSRLQLYGRLVGTGPIKKDPQTGKRYDTRGGRNKIRLAYETTCPDCDTTWWCSLKLRRETNSVCGNCRSHLSRQQRAAPIGTTGVDKHGYVVVKVAEGQKWVRQHRFVMEQSLGRKLLGDETVHHITGDRSDNRIENLQLRRGHHGRGQTYRCADCGSHNVTAIALP